MRRRSLAVCANFFASRGLESLRSSAFSATGSQPSRRPLPPSVMFEPEEEAASEPQAPGYRERLRDALSAARDLLSTRAEIFGQEALVYAIDRAGWRAVGGG